GVVLPQPLSPTSPTTSPGAISRLIPSSTRAGPRSVPKLTSSPRTESSCRAGACPPPPPSAIVHRPAAPQAGIEHVAQAVAEQVEAHDGEEDGQTGGQRVPPGGGQELARLRDG